MERRSRGAGDRSTHRAWNPLRQQLADATRVVAYERAGLGRAEFSPAPRTAETMARGSRAGVALAFAIVAIVVWIAGMTAAEAGIMGRWI